MAETVTKVEAAKPVSKTVKAQVRNMEPQFPMSGLQDDDIKQLAKKNMKSSQL